MSVAICLSKFASSSSSGIRRISLSSLKPWSKGYQAFLPNAGWQVWIRLLVGSTGVTITGHTEGAGKILRSTRLRGCTCLTSSRGTA